MTDAARIDALERRVNALEGRTETWRLQARLTVQQLSVAAGESKRTIQARIHDGTIPALQVGRKWWVLKRDALVYLGEAVPVEPRKLNVAAAEMRNKLGV